MLICYVCGMYSRKQILVCTKNGFELKDRFFNHNCKTYNRYLTRNYPTKCRLSLILLTNHQAYKPYFDQTD